MLIGEGLADLARKLAAKEAAHLEELAHQKRMAILAVLGALAVGVLIGLAL